MGIQIAPVSQPTLYMDATAIVICIGLLILRAKPLNGRDKTAEKLFSLMLTFLMINGLANFISYSLHFQNTGWSAPARMIFPTISEITILYACYAWMMYVDYKVYGSRDRILRTYSYFQIPVIAFTVLSVINLFTGFMFIVDENMRFVWRLGFYFLSIAQYFYGIYPAFVLIRYALTHKKIQFFHIWPTVVPAGFAAFFTLFTPFSARCLGFTIAVVFLYFSYVERWRFNDRESGFFNRHYVDYLLELEEDKLPDYKSVLIIYAENVNQELFSILDSDTPYGGELIRMSEKLFLLFSESAKTSSVKLLSSTFRKEAENYDRTHPSDAPIDLIISYTIREKDQTIKDFMQMAAA